MFLHLSVILFTGGWVSASVHARIPPPPPQEAHTPLGSAPPWEAHPPGSTPLHPREAHPLGSTPPREAPHPQETAAAADGTHSTGMHSCLASFLPKTA